MFQHFAMLMVVTWLRCFPLGLLMLLWLSVHVAIEEREYEAEVTPLLAVWLPCVLDGPLLMLLSVPTVHLHCVAAAVL